MNHKHLWYALLAWLSSWALALGGGSWFAHVEHISEGHGIYWAITTVETVGYGDIVPHTGDGYWIASFVMLLGIPVWGLAVALLTSWLTSLHIWESHRRLKEHISGGTGDQAPGS